MPRLLLRLAPWRRAPLLLWRARMVAAAVIGATAVLVLALGATPVFRGTLGTAEAKRELTPACQASVAPSVQARQPITGKLTDTNDVFVGRGFYEDSALAFIPLDQMLTARRAAIAEEQQTLPMTLPPVETLLSHIVNLGPTRDTSILLARTGWKQHITVVQGSDADGLWVPKALAERLHLQVGQAIDLTAGGTGHTVVAGIYTVPTSPLPLYWCGSAAVLLPKDTNAKQPDVLLADASTLAKLDADVNPGPYDITWEMPLDLAQLRLDRLQALIQRAAGMSDRLNDERTFPVETYVTHDDVSFTATRASKVQKSVSGAVLPVSVLAILVAGLLVAAAGGHWVERQAQEVRLLVSRGVGPAAIALKAALEALPAALLGTAIAVLVTEPLVARVSPGSRLGADVHSQVARAGVEGLVGSVLLIALVAALRTRPTSSVRHRSRWRWLRWIPLDLGLLAVAGLVVVHLPKTAIAGPEGVADPSLPTGLPAFPLLALAGVALLLARIIPPLLRRLARKGRHLRPPAWLALRRVSARPAVTVLLLAATSLPVGAVAYASTTARSTQATVQAKGHTSNGAATSLHIAEVKSLPALTVPGTLVRTTSGVRAPSDIVDVIGIDPRTFAKGAYWSSSYSGTTEKALMQRLERAPRSDTTIPVLVADGPNPGSIDEPVVGRERPVNLDVVGTLSWFPGVRRGVTLVVVPLDAVPDLEFSHTYVWSPSSVTDVTNAVLAAGATIYDSRTSDTILNASAGLPETWTFGYLATIASLTGLIAVAALLLHLVTQRRARQVAALLVGRMGMTARRRMVAHLIEIGAVVGAGAAVGIAVGVGGAAIVHGHLDVAPREAPGALFALPWGPLGVLVLTVLVVIGVAAVVAERSARADPSEVLRATA